jgi:hypothetical protein
VSVLSYVPGTRAWRHRRDVALCRETLDRIDAIVDGEMEGQSLRRHLDACRRCQHEAEAIEGLKQAIERVSEEADPDLVRRLEAEARRLCEDGDC